MTLYNSDIIINQMRKLTCLLKIRVDHLQLHFVFYRVLVLDTWVFDETKGVIIYLNLPWFAKKKIQNSIYNQAYAQGIGRHSKAEVYEILHLDLSAFSQYLGEKISSIYWYENVYPILSLLYIIYCGFTIFRCGQIFTDFVDGSIQEIYNTKKYYTYKVNDGHTSSAAPLVSLRIY